VVCEGEKDAEAARQAGVLAVGTYGATTHPENDVLRPLARFAVVLWPDADGEAQSHAGQRHMEAIGKRLQALGCIPRVVEWDKAPEKGGASDALAQGGPELVVDLVAAALPMVALSAVELRELPTIIVTGSDLPAMTKQALDALAAANSPPFLFVRSGEIVRWRKDERGRSIVEGVTPAYLRGRLARSADWVRSGRYGDVAVHPPAEVVDDVLALGEWEWPALVGVTEVACVREDGSILNTPGYDPASQLIYAPADGFTVPPVPDVPTNGDVDVARARIADVLGEFPFTGDISYANTVALLLTPVVRPAIRGATPLCLLDAPQAGTGKSLLAEIMSLIATGSRAAMMAAPRDDEEWRKQITSTLLDGSSVIVVDNVELPLGSEALARAITATLWKDRLLGVMRNVVVPQRAVWVATGNNIQLRGDMARRCYWVRLDAKRARPWMRSGFAHPDLAGYVRENRGELVGALLTMARAWFASGCPAPAGDLKSLGSMEEWCRVVGGVLAVCGIEGFLENLDALYDQVDQEHVVWEAFLMTWRETLDLIGPVTVAGIVDRAQEAAHLRAAIPDWCVEPKGEINRRKLGRALVKHDGVRVGSGGLRLESAGRDGHTKLPLWVIARDQ
jgi:hypothetical protein